MVSTVPSTGPRPQPRYWPDAAGGACAAGSHRPCLRLGRLASGFDAATRSHATGDVGGGLAIVRLPDHPAVGAESCRFAATRPLLSCRHAPPRSEQALSARSIETDAGLQAMLRQVALAWTGFGSSWACCRSHASRAPRADDRPDAAPGMVPGVFRPTQAASQIAGNLNRICGIKDVR